MDTFSPYDLTAAFQSAIRTARDTGTCRYVIQTAVGYQIRKEQGLVLYMGWKVNADGSIAETYADLGHLIAK